MIWQDAVISIAQLAFIFALFPAILGDQKPPPITCWVTAGALAAIVVAQASMLLYASAFVTLIIAAMWGVLGAQQWRK